MTIQPTTRQPQSFPVLLDTIERDENHCSEELHPPTDVFRSTYHQGRTLAHDRLEPERTPVAKRLGSREGNACFTPHGQAAYLKKGGLYVEGQGHPLVAGRVRLAAIAPDGMIAFVNEDGLYLADRDGNKLRRVGTYFDDEEINDVKWAPEGKTLYYSSYAGIARCDSAMGGKHERIPTSQRVNEFGVAPDGRSIAYTTVDNRLLHQDLATGHETQLAWVPTMTWSWLKSPSFSPDGSRVLFALEEADYMFGDPYTTAELWVASTRGEVARQVARTDITRVATPQAA